MRGLKVLLASRSPRRRGLIQRILPRERIAFAQSEVPEKRGIGEEPDAYCVRLAKEKVTSAWSRCESRSTDIGAVVGADTVVLLDDQIIGQPKDRDDAVRILEMLSGRCHEVITGVAVYFTRSTRFHTFTVRSKVWLNDLSAQIISDYVATGEPMDKAGAYAIQGKGRSLVARYEGSFSNIVGLPLEELDEVLSCLE
jgi:septum formation protein